MGIGFNMETIVLSEEFMKGFHEEHPEFKEEQERMKDMWCECESESEPLFHNDGVVPMDNCVEKHHYHCGWCLGLSQIG